MLLKNLGLREVRVVEVGQSKWAYLAVGQAAAQLLLEWLKVAEEFAIGLDGGRAIRAFVEASICLIPSPRCIISNGWNFGHCIIVPAENRCGVRA
jgi:DNA-binding transcriptional regulator LsrR (DeoR family)